MSAPEAVLLTLYYAVLGVIAVYSVHRYHLVRLRRGTPVPERLRREEFPPLTVQLPLFNEPNVAARVIEAATRLQYPGSLDIQVLDDSSDLTASIVSQAVDDARARGIRIEHVRRGSRQGFKAGALAFGMSRSSSELFAIFDADFVPAPDTLLRLVPYFADPKVGMVQARWTHLNRDQSLLTRVQAILLDAHFAVESAARNFAGRFFNFNGTAGVWRRRAIEEAGGWSASTLTEDLDLSYRAQLAGWHFVFLPEVEVPAELPPTLTGFHQQQHRWAKGSIQTARKLVGPILRSPAPRAVRIEALFHLTNNAAYLLTLLLAVLLLPSIAIRYANAITWTFLIDAVLFVVSTGSVLRFYRAGQEWAGRPLPSLLQLAAVLPVGVGMSVVNGRAVLEGLIQEGGDFRRTPKSGGRPILRGREESPRVPWLESLLTVVFAMAVLAFAARGRWLSLPFLALFTAGFGHVAVAALIERVNVLPSGT